MMDGVTALRWMQDTLTTDPARTGMPAPYALPAGAADRTRAAPPVFLATSPAAAGDRGPVCSPTWPVSRRSG